MFNWIKGWVDWVKNGDGGNKEIGSTIKLPIEHLNSTMERYKGDSRQIPVQIVVIYNVKELASEIAQNLKDGGYYSRNATQHRKGGDNDGK